jgi:EIX receptor 1/2
MRGTYAQLLLLLGLLLCTATSSSFALNNSEVRCIEEERHALLKFKQGLEAHNGMLSSWGNHEEDCCNWKGIKCSNRTGHVVKLDLQGKDFFEIGRKYLSGEISSSILGLQHLTYLDLSWNEFSILPTFIGSFTKLRYLNFSRNFITNETIPPQLGNLTSLISLDLSWNFFGMIDQDNNLDWLIHLSFLRYLDMTYVNLTKAVNWMDKVSSLPYLKELHLSSCYLSSMPIPPVLFNASSSSPLSILDLSSNQLNSSIFPWLFKYANSLVILHLQNNKLEGSIPKAFGNMVALVDVDLSDNNLEGVMPQTLENLHNLQVLDLSNNTLSGEVIDLTNFSFLRELHLFNNQLYGNLSKVIENLSTQLQVLDVSSNSFKSVITEAHLSTYSNLKILDLSFNSLSLKFSPNWVPPFHLDTIRLGSCKMGTSFPQWLQTQKNFSLLDMSDGGISDIIPSWFWDLSFNIQFLNLSHNQITGAIPLQRFSTRFIDLSSIDLSYNRLSGPLPQFPSGVAVLSLSNNLFQGSITSICERNGSVDAYFQELYLLDLSNNLLSGELPNCWGNLMSLEILNLANNNLSGRIPDFICHPPDPRYNSLWTLHLSNNSFTGELPNSLMNCSNLRLLDLGENRLSGRIPAWIGTSLPDLMMLRLTSNLFMGRMPLQLCHLTHLQILDLSHNSITGSIIQCINNFTVMAQKESSDASISYYYYLNLVSLHNDKLPPTYVDNLLVNIKEKYLEYSKTLGLVKVIDLSSNKLKGEIPGEITSLSGLIALNLSSNLLTDIIPQNISHMESLESLDLSRNHLSGIIAPSLAAMSFLSYLNLSNNNLSGKIPTGTQLQSFSASAYAGNRDLCGLPLPKKCLGDEAAQDPQTGSRHEEGNIQEHANSHEHLWFYATIALGFTAGFWGVCGSLILKSSWRHAYFEFFERIGDRLYLTIVVGMPKLLTNLKTRC